MYNFYRLGKKHLAITNELISIRNALAEGTILAELR